MIFNDGYYSAMDRNYYVNAVSGGPGSRPESIGGPISLDIEKPVYDLDKPKPSSKLGPAEIGTGTNPMGNTLQSLVAQIRTGAGKIEFEFIGQGKTNSQQPGPEAFGAKERQDMRDVVELNKIRTSTHASIHRESLGGLQGGEGGSGFRRQAQQKVLKEIEKAIHFAGEATRGGAVVFHSGEFPRPLVDIDEKEGVRFKGYEGEEKEGIVYFVDERTGDLVSSVRKDQKIYEPVFKTEKRNGKEYWVDVKGNLIDKNTTDPAKLFDRVPEWNSNKTNFKVVERDWNHFVRLAEEKNQGKTKSQQVTPGQLYLITQLQNKILQLKGNSLYHSRQYEEHMFEKEKILEAIDFYSKLEKTLPENKKKQLMLERYPRMMEGSHLFQKEEESPTTYLQRKLKEVNDSMRHIHEASASADAQAMEEEERLKYVKPIENVGVKRAWDTLAKAGITAMEHTKKNKDKLAEPIFIAPENFMPGQYGSHPDEIRELVVGARKEMVKKLVNQGYSKKDAEEKAKTHISATLDIGHMNLWRQHFERKEGETIEQRDERFNKWMLTETKKLAKEGIIKHVHLTDNFGYDDEHLTPGQGNVPMKEFIEQMEKEGINDFIAEPGSFNVETSMHDTWALVNGPVYSFARPEGFGFGMMRHAHFGYNAPANYIVGAYSPSNEWKLWSEVPLE